MDKYGKYIKRIPSPDANRTTIFTTFNYAFQNYYSNDFNWAKTGIIPASTFKIPNSVSISEQILV